MRPDLKVGTKEFLERCPSGRRSTPGERMFRVIGTVGSNPTLSVLIHKRDSKPANADPGEEKHWKCVSERAGSEALGGKVEPRRNPTLSG